MRFGNTMLCLGAGDRYLDHMPRPSPTGTPLLLVGYIRVSTAREDMISPGIQRAAQETWAQSNNARIVTWIEDLDASGRNFKRKVQQGINVVERGDAHGILLYRYDRWGRNTHESLANVARVEGVGGRVISVTEPLDPETTIGRYNRTNALALAELQSDIIGDNWRTTLASRVTSGLPPTGTRRFGYRRLGRVPDPVHANRYRRDLSDPAGERYEPDPDTGPVLASLYDRFAAGAGMMTLVHWLNDQGIRTTYGRTWSVQTLISVLDSGFGAGLLRVHDPDCGCKRGLKCGRSVWLPGIHEPVITMQAWDAYRARRQQARALPPRLRQPAYPLSGLLRCGGCQGRLVIAGSHQQRGTGYVCPRAQQRRGCPGVYVPRHVAEAAVLARLAEWADEISAHPESAAAREHAAAGVKSSAARLAGEAAKIDRALARLVEQRALDPDMPGDVWEQARSSLLAQRGKIGDKLAALERAAAAAEPDAAVVVGLLDEWHTLPAARRHDILAALIDSVWVYRTGIRQPARLEVVPVWEAAPPIREVL